MTSEQQLAEDEDTEESRSSWLQHRHTKKRLHAQKEEALRLQEKLFAVSIGSTDPDVRQVAALLHAANLFQKVLEGKDQ